MFASAAALSYAYIGALDGFYGTAYGVMVGVKMAMAGTLVTLGYFNSRRVERLRDDPDAPLLPLRRFTEVEVGIGLTVFLATASLISVPPAVDLREGRLTLAELGARMAPTWPRFDSPEHSELALQKLQAKMDADAAVAGTPRPRLRARRGRAPAVQGRGRRVVRVQPPLGGRVRAGDRRAGARSSGSSARAGRGAGRSCSPGSRCSC